MSETDIFIPELIKQIKGQQFNSELVEKLQAIDQLALDELQQRIEKISNKVVCVKNITTLQRSHLWTQTISQKWRMR